MEMTGFTEDGFIFSILHKQCDVSGEEFLNSDCWASSWASKHRPGDPRPSASAGPHPHAGPTIVSSLQSDLSISVCRLQSPQRENLLSLLAQFGIFGVLSQLLQSLEASLANMPQIIESNNKFEH